MNNIKSIGEKIVVGTLLVCPLIALIMLVLPLIPEVLFRLNPPKFDESQFSNNIVHADESKNQEPGEFKDPKSISISSVFPTLENRIYIPKIGVDTKILEGQTPDVLLSKEGVWRDPSTSTPGKLGNTVIAGHRFQYLPPNQTTFYNLDKLVVGDKVNLYWEGREYKYEIVSIFEVYPNEVWITSPNNTHQELTIYTCTPLFTADKRLVVKAKLI